MGLLTKKKKDTDHEMISAAEPVEKANDNKHFFHKIALSMLSYVKDLILDTKEIGAKPLVSEIDDFLDQLQTETLTESISTAFEKLSINLTAFIKRQSDYLQDRESEFKEIINLLSEGIANLNAENSEFHQKVHEQNEKMEEISQLDDIKQIKTALKSEIEKMRILLVNKEEKEKQRIHSLSSRVDSLQTELEKARSESLMDALTNTNNRKAFDNNLRELIERNKLGKIPFCLLMMDIDNFKDINDTHGHIIGDRVLVAFANKCGTCIREEDFMARYGGEEFAIIMPKASLKVAAKRAKQICKTISGTQYATSKSNASELISVTVSIGVSAFRISDTTKTIVERADKGLYYAKENGKDQVVTEKMLKL